MRPDFGTTIVFVVATAIELYQLSTMIRIRRQFPNEEGRNRWENQHILFIALLMLTDVLITPLLTLFAVTNQLGNPYLGGLMVGIAVYNWYRLFSQTSRFANVSLLWALIVYLDQWLPPIYFGHLALVGLGIMK